MTRARGKGKAEKLSPRMRRLADSLSKDHNNVRIFRDSHGDVQLSRDPFKSDYHRFGASCPRRFRERFILSRAKSTPRKRRAK